MEWLAGKERGIRVCASHDLSDLAEEVFEVLLDDLWVGDLGDTAELVDIDDLLASESLNIFLNVHVFALLLNFGHEFPLGLLGAHLFHHTGWLVCDPEWIQLISTGKTVANNLELAHALGVD